MKKYLAEMIGTMVLVLMGCGTAVSLNCGVDTASVVGTAMAFGLAVVAMASPVFCYLEFGFAQDLFRSLSEKLIARENIE